MKVDQDDSFEFFEGRINPPTACLSVQQGVVDFPARCVLTPEHSGPHRSASGYVGGHPTKPTHWTDDE